MADPNKISTKEILDTLETKFVSEEDKDYNSTVQKIIELHNKKYKKLSFAFGFVVGLVLVGALVFTLLYPGSVDTTKILLGI